MRGVKLPEKINSISLSVSVTLRLFTLTYKSLQLWEKTWWNLWLLQQIKDPTPPCETLELHRRPS